MDRATLLTLTRDDLIALIEAKTGQIVVLATRIAELEAKLAPRLIPSPDGTDSRRAFPDAECF